MLTDQGLGINPSLKHKVFDAFYQGQAPINTQIKGSGLGLTIVKELLLRLNGSIKIVDTNQYDRQNKQGTCVSITLPNRQSEN
jgi:two-component system sensor histidine kinase GlrK